MAHVESHRERSKERLRLDVTSTAFREGGRIPVRYTGDGQNVSPPLAWTDPPATTKSFAVVCEDPDAPSGLFVHWLAWGIRADQRGLNEGISPSAETWEIVQGENDFGRTGYLGPKPPPGKPHRYMFRVYALDHRPDLAAGASRTELDREIRGHVLADGVLVGMYGR